jgi:hypothetical protein
VISQLPIPVDDDPGRKRIEYPSLLSTAARPKALQDRANHIEGSVS